MKPLFTLAFWLPALTVSAQALTNDGATISVQAGTTLYVGGGVLNKAGSTLANNGTVQLTGDFTNAATATSLSGTGLLHFSGSTDQTLTSPAGTALANLQVSNTGSAGANRVLLPADLTVTTQLTMTSGLVHTAPTATLLLPDGATLTGEAAGRYVQGNLRAVRNAVSGSTAVAFPNSAALNPNGQNLGTVGITRTAGLQMADVSFGQNLNNAGLRGIDGIWTVAPATQPSAPVQLTLSWLPDNDNGLTDFSQARGYQQLAAGQPWAPLGAPTNASARSIAISAVDLNRFTVSNLSNPLPVTLLDFSARAEGPAAVRLAWATATELNNAGFTVERSRDAHSFIAVSTVAGAGNSQLRHDYTLLDNKLPAGATLLYYRLRQTDASGEISYSSVRQVALTPPAAGFVVYPTRLTTGQAAQYLYTGPAEAGTLQILNVLGQVLGTVALDGRAQGEVPLTGLSAGAYFLRYTGPAGRFITRCVVE